MSTVGRRRLKIDPVAAKATRRDALEDIMSMAIPTGSQQRAISDIPISPAKLVTAAQKWDSHIRALYGGDPGGYTAWRKGIKAAKILADMAIALETNRLHYLSAAYMMDHPDIYGSSDQGFMPARIKMGQVYAGTVAEKVISEAMNLMGSYGYVRENHIEKYWRDAKLLALALGGIHFNSFNVCRGYYDLEL